MSAEEEDRLDFGEDDEDRESEISLGANGDDEQAADAAGEVEIATEESANARESRVKYDDDANKDNDGAESPLPAGWQRRYSRNNELYYFNKTANVTTWDRPTATATLEEDVETAQEAQTPVVEEVRNAKRASVPGTVKGVGSQSQQQHEAYEAEADKEKVSTSASNGNGNNEGNNKSATAAWGRRPQPDQKRAFSRVESINKLSQPPISRPPTGPSASRRQNDDFKPPTPVSAGSSSSIPTEPRRRPAATSSTTSISQGAATATGQAGLPTGPKADRSRGGPQQGGRSFTGPSGPRGPPASSQSSDLSGLPKGPSAARNLTIPSAASSSSRPPHAPSGPSHSNPGRSGHAKARPSMDSGWPDRPVKEARSPPPNPPRNEHGRPRGPLDLPPTERGQRYESDARQGRPETASVRDQGWPKRATMAEAPIERGRDDYERPRPPRLRQGRSPSPVSYRSKGPLPAQGSLRGHEIGRRGPSAQASRPRSPSPPPRSLPARRSVSPLPTRPWQVAEVQAESREYRDGPIRSRNAPLAPGTERRLDRPLSPPPARRDDRRRQDAPPAGRVRSARSLTPPPRNGRKAASPPPQSKRPRVPSPVISRTQSDQATLLSRMNQGNGVNARDRFADRDDGDLRGPPSKKYRGDSDVDRKRDDRMEVDERPDLRRNVSIRRVRSISPATANESRRNQRRRSPISLAGAGTRERAGEGRRDKPSDMDVDDTFVDIAKLPGVVLSEVQDTDQPLIRLYNPGTGSSTDARAVLKHIEAISIKSPAHSSNSAPSTSKSAGSEPPTPASAPGRLIPVTAIPGLPPKPVVSDAMFDSMHERHRPTSPLPPTSRPDIRDSYRPKPSRGDSRDQFTHGRPRRPSSRSPPPSAVSRSRPRSPSPPRREWGRDTSNREREKPRVSARDVQDRRR